MTYQEYPESDNRKEVIGFSMELQGPRIRFEGSADPVAQAALRASISTWVESAPIEIEERIERIRSSLARYPTANLLAQLTAAIKMGDPETYKEYELEHPDIELEYATWLILQLPAPVRGSDWIDGPVSDRLLSQLREVVQMVSLYHVSRMIDQVDTFDEISSKARTHDMFVRRPGYEHHLQELLLSLFGPLHSELKGVAGFSIEDAISATEVIRIHVNDRIESMIAEAREQFQNILQPLKMGAVKGLMDSGLSEDESAMLLSVPLQLREEQAWAFLIGRAINHFQTAMSIDAPTLVSEAGISMNSASSFLEVFSIGFGQKPVADNWPSRYEALTVTPLVKFDQGAYFAHLIDSLLWSIQPNLELRFRESGLWQRYESHRSKVVEAEAFRLLTDMLKGSRGHRNLKYKMPDADGRLQEYEVDGLIFYDDVLIILETKGGHFGAAARRGAPSLKDKIKEVLATAHGQADRAALHMQQCEEPVFRTASGDEIVVRFEEFRQVIEVAVTLESIAAVASGWESLFDFDVPDNRTLRWSVELLDLRVISEVIEFGPQFIHYLDCLARVPSEILHFNDALDTLGNYFERGLNFGYELSYPTSGIQLLTYTTAFDDYFRYEMGARETPANKPAMDLDRDTYMALRILCESAEPGFLKQACRLLDQWRDNVEGTEQRLRL